MSQCRRRHLETSLCPINAAPYPASENYRYETPPCLSVSTKLSLEYCFCDAWTRSGGGRDSDEINQITVLKKALKDEYPRCSVAQQ